MVVKNLSSMDYVNYLVGDYFLRVDYLYNRSKSSLNVKSTSS